MGKRAHQLDVTYLLLLRLLTKIIYGISLVTFSALTLLVGGRKGIWPVKNGGIVEMRTG